MAELDYQISLLIQQRFESEQKSINETEKADQELARQLQEQFQQEAIIDRPSNLVYKHPKNGLNSTKCLTDPSWELVDPTPDIHNLFLVFNERFFWSKLVTVCVSWSKRMTSCAGICSYNGSGGMCSITLSEPLLKLRPRKDLVETLLHEMIHAYLFVTHNNRDRDGHGPEFHKHMYRINNESGTNITVYHDFHDEVRLYQQHWWRCNGPCQHRKPFFGTVRRATNRAPGPNDRWWAEHSRTCGGTFIKVKEPEKKEKENKKLKIKAKVTSSVKSKDIRSFIQSASDNIKDFNDLNNAVKGKYNSSSTIVVTKNNVTNPSSYKPAIMNSSIEGTVKPVTDKSSCSDDFLAVRNHWADKYNDSKKRPSEDQMHVSKIPKLSDSTLSESYSECPICGKRVLIREINYHLDVCLISSESNQLETIDLTQCDDSEDSKECPLCNEQVPASYFDGHVEKCIFKIYNDIERRLTETEPEKVPCLSCGKEIVKNELNLHLDECMSDIFPEDREEINDFNDDKASSHNSQEKITQFNCPYCMQLIDESVMEEHLENCC